MSFSPYSNNGLITKPRAREIEQQLAQLRWRRMQNERNIRNYLESTKVMKQKDTILGLTIDQSAERMQWLDSIVRDELTRPLVLSDEELHKVQYEENKMKKRLSKVQLLTYLFYSCFVTNKSFLVNQYAKQQLENLNKLQHDLEERHPRTADGKVIRELQLDRFSEIEGRLQDNISSIDQKKPFIQVKQVVQKLY